VTTDLMTAATALSADVMSGEPTVGALEPVYFRNGVEMSYTVDDDER